MPDTTLSVFAGTGSSGDGGDGGPAGSALLGQVTGLAVDGIGRVFIGDAGNHRIRVVDLASTITTAEPRSKTTSWLACCEVSASSRISGVA